jgi:pimeloyl-ACP methyl ester carboxylesterase
VRAKLHRYGVLAIRFAAVLALVASIALPGCAATPPLAGEGAVTPADASLARSLAGTWIASMKVEYDLQNTYVVHLNADEQGQLSGTLDDPGEADYGTKIPSVTLKQRDIAAALEHATIEGRVSDDGTEIHGAIKPGGLLNRMMIRAFTGKTAFPIVMRRADAATLPAYPQSHTYTLDGHTIHYLEVAPATEASATASDGPRVLFIHGSPGGLGDWAAYMTNVNLQRRATLISVDRPGWGDSDRGKMVLDMHEQARLLAPLLAPLLHGTPGTDPAGSSRAGAPAKTIVVGWSLGGPIAAELAMDYPNQVQRAILIAPAIDPDRDGAQWYNQAVDFWPIGKLTGWILGNAMTLSNQEMMPLGGQLKAMEPRWKSLTVPITVIQGDADALVDPKTADYAAHTLPTGTEVIVIPGADHAVVFTQKAMDVLNSALDRLTPPAMAGVK